MAVIFCEECGYEIPVDSSEETVVCPACGAKNRIPVSISRTEQKYQMAIRQRMRKNFDAAREYYENLLEEDPEELEACFGILLCKYGVEYKTEGGKAHIIRCHRIVETAVTSDIYYKTLSAYADEEHMAYYSAEAAKIQKAQQELLRFAKQEARYDVYLCYKEQGIAKGDPTDKENIKELVSFLEQLGVRVFYDREKTEKEHPGQAYSYLLAAQYNAPVMVVYGTKKSFFSDESVLQEWSSYRALTAEKNSSRKMIVACPEAFMYSLPEVLLDLTKVNIDKLDFYDQLKNEIFKGRKTGATEGRPKNDVLENLYTRAQFALEDGNFDEADGYYQRILEKQPEESRAYWGRLLCECRCMNGEQLKKRGSRIDDMTAYRFAVRYALENDRVYYEEISDSILEAIKEKESELEQKKLKSQEAAQQEKIRKEKEKLDKELEEKKRKRKRAARRAKFIGFGAAVVVIALAAGSVWYSQTGQYQIKLRQAESYMEKGQYEEAEDIFTEEVNAGRIGEEALQELYYRWGKACLDGGSYFSAVDYLSRSNGYEDANAILDGMIEEADRMAEEQNISDALSYYDLLSDYNPSHCEEKIKEILAGYRDWLSVYKDHAVIKKADGTALIYGYGVDASMAAGWTGLAGVYASESSVFGWTEEGKVYASGNWQTDNFSDWSNIVQVVGNAEDVFGRTADGTIVARSGKDTSYVTSLTDVKRLCMGTDGSLGVIQTDGTLRYYSSRLGKEAGTCGTVSDANYAGSVLVVLHEDGWLEKIGGNALLEESSVEPLFISQTWSMITFVGTKAGAGGSYCGANHFWYNLNGQISGKILNVASGVTETYDEYLEGNTPMNICITASGDVKVYYSVFSKNQLGATLVDYQEELVANVFQ